MSSHLAIKMDRESWTKETSELAHKIAFDEIRPAAMERIDFAILLVDPKTNIPAGYCTVRELDSESVYWQYGGAFPGVIQTINVSKVYSSLIDWFRGKYKRITTLVSNENVAYLKLAMAFGFRIIGIRMFGGEIFVELLNNLEGKENVSVFT